MQRPPWFDAEDWTDSNRLSFWVYPHLPGFQVISLLVKLHNQGTIKVPDEYGREGLHYFLLKNDQWNHVVVEIAHLARDKVTGVQFIYRLQGSDVGATKTVTFDFDRLELQRVEPDYYEGWAVALGRIAFSHTGYRPSSRKIALASGLPGKRFQLCDARTGEVVLTRDIRVEPPVPGMADVTVPFQMLDFTEVRKSGAYRLQVGDIVTRPFRIDSDIWDRTIEKTINFFYCERCGQAIPGVHGLCHQDWQSSHNGKRLPIHGGWHDAGDLSQGCTNTAEATTAMFRLALRLGQSKAALSKRLIEEGRWGLKWLLKTRYGDGFRTTWSTMDFWTDNQIGTADDVVTPAANSPSENLAAAAAEAVGVRALKRDFPEEAAAALCAAEEDWRFAMAKVRPTDLPMASLGAVTSLELYQTTQKKEYAERAVELAEVILASQEQQEQKWNPPLRGFFYTSPHKDALLHFEHRGHHDAPAVALCRLCEALPDHTRQGKWREAVVLHGQYLLSVSKWTGPYAMIPAGIYRLDSVGGQNQHVSEQIKSGFKVAEGVYLKRFPVWSTFRGNNGVLLSQTKALSAVARLLNDRELAELTQRQLEWVVGRNPFCQSLMYGEGYDYQPQYTAMSGDMVGSLPVGIQTRADGDAPYWSTMNCYNHKEVWVHPSARWLAILEELVPADKP